MKFGYFTLSDNHHADNPRSSNQFIADIIDEALYAEDLGMHSAWIGEQKCLIPIQRTIVPLEAGIYEK
jgi:hypothetical protein